MTGPKVADAAGSPRAVRAAGNSLGYLFGQILPEQIDGHAGKGNILAAADVTPGIRMKVHAIKGQRLNLVPNRVAGGDPHPHLPIFTANKSGIKRSDGFIDITPHDDRRSHDSLFLG